MQEVICTNYLELRLRNVSVASSLPCCMFYGWAGLAYTAPSPIFISTNRVFSGEERLVLYLPVRSAGEQDVARAGNRYQTISFYKHH